jgi:queuine tRNA-ribosyltransferase
MSDSDVNSNTNNESALSFDIKSCFEYSRTSILTLKHGKCRTPMFMPVGTQAAIKGITSGQMKDLDVDLMLCNTYFMNLRPRPDVVSDLGGLHGLMNWGRCILTPNVGFDYFILLSYVLRSSCCRITRTYNTLVRSMFCCTF